MVILSGYLQLTKYSNKNEIKIRKPNKKKYFEIIKISSHFRNKCNNRFEKSLAKFEICI